MSDATTEAPPPATPLVPVPLQYESLDPAVVNLWRVSNLIGCFFMAVVAAIIGISLAIVLPSDRLYVGLASLLVLAFCIYRVAIYPQQRYKAWGFRLDGKVLEIKSGILERSLHLLPLSRLQHVDLEQGLFERLFKVASLHFYTAGTQFSRLTIPGLSVNRAKSIRDSLLEKGGDDGV